MPSINPQIFRRLSAALVIGTFAAGTAFAQADIARGYIGQRLADRIGHGVVVDNRPAASGIVGTELVAKAVPDGYTLLLAYSTHAQSAQLFTTLPYDPIKDFAPVTEVIATPLTMQLNPNVPAKTVQEFIAYAKANAGKLNYGSSGPGSSPHLAAELFASMAGIKMTHIPYKGVALYVTAQIGNEIQFAFSNMFTTMSHWKAGRRRRGRHGRAGHRQEAGRETGLIRVRSKVSGVRCVPQVAHRNRSKPPPAQDCPNSSSLLTPYS